jgi:hypothetical protein
LLGSLAREFGPKGLVPVAFHVDYFDDPWKDPYSDERYSRREYQYSVLHARARGLENEGILYLTPLMMVNGRVPFVGSNGDAPALARAAIRRELARAPEVVLGAKLEREGAGATKGRVVVEVGSAAGVRAGSPVLVEVVVVEDELSTAVKKGELEGKTYRARHVARSFAAEGVRLPEGGGRAKVEVPVQLPEGCRAEKASVVVIVQDEETGEILQCRRRPWAEPPAKEGREA